MRSGGSTTIAGERSRRKGNVVGLVPSKMNNGTDRVSSYFRPSLTFPGLSVLSVIYFCKLESFGDARSATVCELFDKRERRRGGGEERKERENDERRKKEEEGRIVFSGGEKKEKKKI